MIMKNTEGIKKMVKANECSDYITIKCKHTLGTSLQVGFSGVCYFETALLSISKDEAGWEGPQGVVLGGEDSRATGKKPGWPGTQAQSQQKSNQRP